MIHDCVQLFLLSFKTALVILYLNVSTVHNLFKFKTKIRSIDSLENSSNVSLGEKFFKNSNSKFSWRLPFMASILVNIVFS